MPPSLEPTIAAPSISQKMVSWLFREGQLSLSFSEWWQLFSATLLIRNRTFLDEFFRALASKIEQSLADPSLSDVKKDVLLYNTLSYIAFSDPQADAMLNIKGLRYTIEKIQLTSGWLSSPYYAYGLKAVDEPDAQSILIFRGTTFPTDHGFLSGLLADSRPNGAIGSQLYSRGQKELQAWISSEYQRTGKSVMCTGQSLGGAMSLLCHIHQPDEVDFFVINPPSLTNREKLIHEGMRPRPIDDSRRLEVVSHINDPVLGLGSMYFPPGTKILRHGNKQEHWYNAHAKTVDFSPECEKPLYQEHDNTRRKRNFFWKILKPILFFGVVLLHALAFSTRVLLQIGYKIAEFHNNTSSTLLNHNSTEEQLQNQFKLLQSHYRQHMLENNFSHQRMADLFIGGVLPQDRYYDTSTGTSGRPTMWVRSQDKVAAEQDNLRLGLEFTH